MAKLLKLRRGTTSQHSSFTGAEGEVTVDTTKDTLVVHDGSTAGGVPLAKESDNLSLIDEDDMATNSNSRPPSQQSVKAYVDAKVPTSITVADESSDTTCFPLFVTAATGDLAPKTGSNFTFNSSTGKVVIGGDLQVQGTTTTVDSTTMTVADKNIEIAKGAADDAAADGAGITVDSGDGDKTWNWVDATDAWTSSEHIHVGDNKKLIAGTGSDFSIYHDGSGSYLQGNSSGTGNVYLDANGSKGIYIRSGDGASGVHQAVSCVNNAQVELYHDNTKKFETTANGVTVSGSVTDDKGNVRSIPRNGQGNAYTLVAADAGKAVGCTATVTVPNSVFAAGDAVTIMNENTSSNITIAQGAGFTLWNATAGTNAAGGDRTLLPRGICTIYFPSSSQGYISGAGLS